MGGSFNTMIVKLLLNILYSIFSVLTLPLEFPSMPVKVVEIFATVLDYITSGIAMLGTYIDMGYLLSLFSIIVIIDFNILAYRIIMWILKKIPVLGIQ